ncbi:MAG: DUF2264 domain-containing protein [Oscillospiraceae bacterium]|nr:DUF2264 domain-containing protein [Oscillospiraceae bacterium]
MSNPAQQNPLLTRADFERAALDILAPLSSLLSPGCARLRLGETGAVYPQAVAEMEAYSRALWALAPLAAAKCAAARPLIAQWRAGLAHGTDPAHPEYWGDIGDFDQRMVEMAAIALALMIAPDDFYHCHPTPVRANIAAWLGQINRYDMPVNNWRFFRVLVNTAFRCLGLPQDEARLAEDFALIEEHYVGGGWYYDYPDQREYYTHWAYHYYGLIYARVVGDSDTARAASFRERAAEIAPRFAAWFNRDGEALPYGRSLTYRFAQGSLFSAMAFAGVTPPGLGYGQLKGLVLRHMRAWLAKPIFTRDGVLTIGYGYPNLLMAEGYNAPGSPYWALKIFLPLALPDDHPFWQAPETPCTPPQRLCDEPGRMLIVRDRRNLHVQAFCAGNHAAGHAHDDAKYEKFAYSTAFAFSVPKSVKVLARGAFDSMLALSDDGLTWHGRYGRDAFGILPDRVTCTWRPFADVIVQTEIVPLGDWHLRAHRIHTPRPLFAAEGGYAIRLDPAEGDAQRVLAADRAAVLAPWGASGAVALRGYGGAEIVQPEPNTNLLYPRTLLPTLRAELPAGESLLVCAVLGAVTDGENQWANLPGEAHAYATLGR